MPEGSLTSTLTVTPNAAGHQYVCVEIHERYSAVLELIFFLAMNCVVRTGKYIITCRKYNMQIL
jgi:hypothetical protein